MSDDNMDVNWYWPIDGRSIDLPPTPPKTQPDQPLSGWTTFGIGGPAGQFTQATSIDELVNATRFADATNQPLFVLSGGSNVLVGDDGFPGLVVRVANRGIKVFGGNSQTVMVQLGAGEPMDAFIAQAVEDGWSGLEMLSGIPGLAGAAPVQNIGAYGAQIADAMVAVLAWDRAESELVSLTASECRFGYRDSIFKQSRQPGQATGRHIILAVQVRLTASPLSAPIAYGELAEALSVQLGDQAPLADVRQAVLGLRRGKGMVVSPDDPDSHSAGSFFTNPWLSPAQAAQLPADAPRFKQPNGDFKTSAAWLIERAGFPKGFGTGPARLSSKHTLALTNQGGASAVDIAALANLIVKGVNERFGVRLQPEPTLVGCEI